MAVMVFHTKKFGCAVSSIQVYFAFLDFFLTLQSPLVKHTCILSHVFSNPASSEEENRGKNTGVCHSRTSVASSCG